VIAEVERVVRGDSHDDAFLGLACGLRAAISRFDELLAQYAPPKDARAPDEERAPELVELLLGMIAIRERLASVTEVPVATLAAPAPASSPLDGSLLR
jgi:hypothetical protein